MKKTEKIINITRTCTIPFILFVFPIVCITAAGENEWIGRLITLTVVFTFGIPTLFWWALNPKSNFITKRAKLNQPKFKKIKRYIDFLMRLVIIAFGICLLWGTAIPLAIGVGSLMRDERPVVVRGCTTSITTPFPLLEFLSQEIVLENTGDKTTYRFWYSLRPRLKHNRNYEFLILPRSRLVLEAKELKEMRK